MKLEYTVSGTEPSQIREKAEVIARSFYCFHRGDEIIVEVDSVQADKVVKNAMGETIRVSLWEANCRAWVESDPELENNGEPLCFCGHSIERHYAEECRDCIEDRMHDYEYRGF